MPMAIKAIFSIFLKFMDGVERNAKDVRAMF